MQARKIGFEAARCEGYDDDGDLQRVYLGGSSEDENTLFKVLYKVLSTLENCPDPGFDEEDQELLGLIKEIMMQRHQAVKKQFRNRLPVHIAVGILLVITPPLLLFYGFVRPIVYDVPKFCINHLRHKKAK